MIKDKSQMYSNRHSVSLRICPTRNPLNRLRSSPTLTSRQIYLRFDRVWIHCLVSWRWAFAKCSFSTSSPIFNAQSKSSSSLTECYTLLNCVFQANSFWYFPGGWDCYTVVYSVNAKRDELQSVIFDSVVISSSTGTDKLGNPSSWLILPRVSMSYLFFSSAQLSYWTTITTHTHKHTHVNSKQNAIRMWQSDTCQISMDIILSIVNFAMENAQCSMDFCFVIQCENLASFLLKEFADTEWYDKTSWCCPYNIFVESQVAIDCVVKNYRSTECIYVVAFPGDKVGIGHSGKVLQICTQLN